MVLLKTKSSFVSFQSLCTLSPLTIVVRSLAGDGSPQDQIILCFFSAFSQSSSRKSKVASFGLDMGCVRGRAMHGAAGIAAFVVLLAFTAQQAQGTRVNAFGDNYENHEAQQQQQQQFVPEYVANGTNVALFERWSEKHGRVYRSLSEKERRFQIFEDNLLYIHNHNKQQSSTYWMGLNKFSDLTQEEFSMLYLGGYQTSRSPGLVQNDDAYFVYNDVVAATHVDWRQKGAISKVKNQGQCGSCWAFAAIGAVEAVNQITTGKMITLSEQELLDCDLWPNQGCKGGYMKSAFQYIYENGGIRTENDYPYNMSSGSQCVSRKHHSTVVTIDGYKLVPTQSENALLKAVTMTPVTVAIEASGREFQHYQGGVFTGSCGTELNHGVLVVGFGSDEQGRNYWTVKNSWGDFWGEAGFIRIQRLGSTDPLGKCGINLDPVFPIKHARSA